MKFIEVLNLLFKYKIFTADQENPEEKTVLQNVSFSINKGDFVGILGHNGSGKSTLAKQLTALLKPTDGVVYINGMNSSNEEDIIPIRKSTGMVFQNPDNQLIGNVVEEDIAFGPENLGVPTDEIWNRIENALAATGMTAYRFHSPSALSGGQKQKIAISGILAMEPECIVFDEPTAMLDPKGRQEVLEAIRILNQEKGITVIYITHHVDEVKNANYLYLMNQGTIVLQGSPSDFWRETAVLKQYGITLPFEQELIFMLKNGGLDIPENVSTKEELNRFLSQSMKTLTSIGAE